MRISGKLVLWGLMLVLLLSGPALAFSQIAQTLERADELDKLENHRGVIDLLTPALGTAGNNTDRAEIAWRLARATLGFGDQQKDAGVSSRDLLAIFEQGEAYADQAIQWAPNNPLGYFWKSSNIGRWGQTRGILDSLSKAPVMRDLLTQAITMDVNHADSYYVLGQLYAAVPRIISFGNQNYAVSLARKAVDLNQKEVAAGIKDEPNYGYYLKLAEHLNDRNWNAARRTREQANKQRDFNRTTVPLERGWYFEGTITIPNMTDRQEARQITDQLIGWLTAKPSRTPSQERNLREARELLAKL